MDQQEMQLPSFEVWQFTQFIILGHRSKFHLRFTFSNMENYSFLFQETMQEIQTVVSQKIDW